MQSVICERWLSHEWYSQSEPSQEVAGVNCKQGGRKFYFETNQQTASDSRYKRVYYLPTFKTWNGHQIDQYHDTTRPVQWFIERLETSIFTTSWDFAHKRSVSWLMRVKTIRWVYTQMELEATEEDYTFCATTAYRWLRNETKSCHIAALRSTMVTTWLVGWLVGWLAMEQGTTK